MKQTKVVIIAVIIVIVIIGFFICRKPKKQLESTTNIQTDVPVSIMTVQKMKLTSNISLVGTINANNDVNVIAETQGVAKAVYAKVGDFVKAGTVLIQVDDEIPRSNLATAEINFEKTKKDFERAEDLFQENSIPVSQLDAARLGMKAAENQLDIARRQLENTKIKSPIAGTVNARYVNIGTMVGAGNPVANIVDITTLKVRVNVTEREAFQLKPGDRVEISTDVYPGEIFEGHIDNIASKADEAHTYAVEIVLPNSKEHPLKAGMFARISFSSIAATEALTIPRMALIGSIKNAQVYQVRKNIAFLREIVIGKQNNEFLEVLNGLSLGDTVVTSGQNNLSDSTRVNVVESRMK
jgi:RND family efflux transporter MFP subunit